MKKLITAGIMALVASPFTMMADITVKLPPNANLDSLTYDYTTIPNIATAKTRADLGTVTSSVAVKNNTAVIPIQNDKGGYRFNIQKEDKPIIRFYAVPGDNVNIEILSLEPVDYNISGSDLVAQNNEIMNIEKPYKDRMEALSKEENPDREKMQGVYSEFLDALKEFIDENPTSQASCFAIMYLNGEDFDKAYSRLGEGAKVSPIFPLVEQQNARVQKSLAKERKMNALMAGDVEAPNFTLLNLEGKPVSLSDFKGKWVILDFWGAWCPWCIKGFPELKEAYAKYKGELEIIGIDCQEPEKAWRDGVAKYELPWVNVYNPSDSSVLDDYGVQGFPTKAIINPEGKIANITVGHNPAFFEKLTELMGK